MNNEQYYAIRESGLHGGIDGHQLEVHIFVPESCVSNPAIQLITLNLLNLILRFVPTVSVYLLSEHMPLLVRYPFAKTSLGETIRNLFEVCDPRGNFSIHIGSKFPKRDAMRICIGVGVDAIDGCDFYLSSDRYIGYASSSSSIVQCDGAIPIGAGVAALMGAANVARIAARLDPLHVRLSGWNFREGEHASQGPSGWAPIDAGIVRLFGAGAVGSALIYWLYQWGVEGEWQIIDPDMVKLKNISKSLLYSTSEAAEFAPAAIKKAESIARWLPRTTPYANWHNEYTVSTAKGPDLVIAVANERGVRPAVAAESRCVVLHATTNTDWDSMLHRHVAGIDDCIACRIPETGAPKFQCSTGRIESPIDGVSSFDSSLPFVAGASGLMLAALMNRLQRGELLTLPENCVRWHWKTAGRLHGRSRYSCNSGCSNYLSAKTRARANAYSRWASLDPASGK